MNMIVIFAVMNTALAVVKIKPEKNLGLCKSWTYDVENTKVLHQLSWQANWELVTELTSQLGASNCKCDLKGFKTNFETFVLLDSVIIWHLLSRKCVKKPNYVHFWKNNSTSLANKLKFNDCHSNFFFTNTLRSYRKYHSLPSMIDVKRIPQLSK